MIFDFIDPESYYAQPIALRHPFAFYEGHIPAFSFLTLNERALGEAPLDAGLERLFERGIDPADAEAAKSYARADWPSRQQIQDFARACDRRVESALRDATLIDPQVPPLRRGQAAYTILEHEPMHHETLMYLIHQLPDAQKNAPSQGHRDGAPPRNAFVAISAGRITLGANPDELDFGWDNEFPEVRAEVGEFEMQRYPVTNADYLEFIEAGGPVPLFWAQRDGQWLLRTAFETIALPRSWPVYVTHEQAQLYANWKGWRLPSEAQFHRAAYGDPNGPERAFPWGADKPEPRHGNFGFRRFDPEPVDAHPDGASAFGVEDLVGNGWEWTSTAFEPFAGFDPMASYPQYSADFFDGKHFVMKGASPVTATEFIRRSFRNWFYEDYPYMYAKFRCAR